MSSAAAAVGPEQPAAEQVPPPEPPPAGGFRWLWSAQTVSLVGSSVTVVALPALAVLRLGASPFEVGLLAAAVRLPYPVLGLVAGVVADRLPRRTVMVACDLARVLVLGSIPVADAAGKLSVGLLVGIAALSGVFGVFFDIADLAFVPTLVGRRGLARAYSWLEVTNATSSLVGPGLGGLLVQALGAARAVAADAFSFLASALLILRIRPPRDVSAAPPPGGRRPSAFSDLSEGVLFVVREPVLRTLLASQAVMVVGAHAIEAPLLVFAYRDLRLSPGAFGLLLTIGGVGSMAGAVLSRRTGRRAPGPVLVVASLVVGACVLALPLATLAPPLVLLPGILVLDTLAGTVGNVTQVTLRQSLTPAPLQGRMNSLFRVVYWGAWPLANLLGGLLAGVTGPVPAILAGGGVVLASAALAAMRPLREARLPA